jgi:F0F1-type ATP synthase assembly protein I
MPNDEPNRVTRGLGEGYSYVGAGFAFALAILTFGALGWLVDGWLHTRPAFAIGGAMLGGFGGFMSIYFRVQRDVAADKRNRGPSEPGTGGKRTP